jgi:undecaprenyl-phosphate 4-deoxy-4-formamido-L-arabinose transferase
MAKPLLSFVIPCYRSEETIPLVVREIADTVATRRDEYDHEIILVNDGSPDGVPG